MLIADFDALSRLPERFELLLKAEQLVDAKVATPTAAAAIEADYKLPNHQPKHTFNIMALSEMGQLPTEKCPFNGVVLWGKSFAWWAFVLLFIGFIIKVPAVPFHTWLPDAHVEAPTPISMILAGVLLKMGGYGIIRICVLRPHAPRPAVSWRYWVWRYIGVLSMVYGAFAALAQKDFKRLVAYSSVSHMGYVLLGLGVWSATMGMHYDPSYWQQGVNGAMFQMIAHGISSAGMFFLVGVVYDRVHHRNLDQFGGLFARMPLYSGIAIGIFFAALGLPGLCGFIGEIFVTLSAWKFSHVLAVISASVVILTAGYILWTIQRVFLGPEYKGPHGDHLTRITPRELAIAVPLLTFAIVLGVYPQALFNYMERSTSQSVTQLAKWTEVNVKDGKVVTPPQEKLAGPAAAPISSPVSQLPLPSPRRHPRPLPSPPTVPNREPQSIIPSQTSMTPLPPPSSLSQLVDALLRETAALSLPAFRTELALCATIVAMLLFRILRGGKRLDAFFLRHLAFSGSLVGLSAACVSWTAAGRVKLVNGHVARHEFFTGMLVYDSLTLYFRCLLMFFAADVRVILTRITGIPDREDAPEFYTLVLGATLGMCIMVSANHLLIDFPSASPEMAQREPSVCLGRNARRAAGRAAEKRP